MLQLRDALTCGLLFWVAARAAPPSAEPNRNPGASDAAGRRLTGRFLHITDFHPDPFYKTYSSTTSDAACHRKRGPAGIYGAETSGCDSPFSLVNETFKWINDNIKDEIDFVIWTGDSARHDNDEEVPRTQKEIIQQNKLLVSKFAEVFGQSDHPHDGSTNRFAIPIIPTFGNNDIMPHNIMLEGPNKWTTKYLDVWRSFIPEAQRHQFQQGGWFFVEVIPGKLAVVSLNTMYFFASNSGTDGCAKKHEPGYEHMEWLRIQLQIMRDRGMKAILMGHVPPARVDSKNSWDETCWQKYTLWQRQYRDVIVGSLYGHMNIDHFMLQDFEHINKDTEDGRMASISSQKRVNGEMGLLKDGELTMASASDYLLDLRLAWAQLPSPPAKSNKKSRSRRRTFDDEHNEYNEYEEEEDLSIWEWLVSKVSKPSESGKANKGEKQKYLEKIGGKYAERYSTTHVAPSVVPNYYPTLRIIEYNITGLEHIRLSSFDSNNNTQPLANSSPQHPLLTYDFSDDTTYKHTIDSIIAQKKKHSRKGPRKYKFNVPTPPSKSSPPGPAYSPQTLTLTRYVQYFANLTQINNDFVDGQQHHHHSPPLTTSTSTSPDPINDESESPNDLSPHTIFGLPISPTGSIDPAHWKEGKHGKHQGKQPRPEPHPNPFLYEVEYDTKGKGFPDLTVRRWVEYARRIGQGAGGKKATPDVDADTDADADESATHQDEQGVDSTQGGHKKKHHKKFHGSKAWLTFVKRAFVGTIDSSDIESLFDADESSSSSFFMSEEEERRQEEEKKEEEVIEL